MSIQNPDYTYVQKVKVLCYKIDCAIKKFIADHDFISSNKTSKDRKVNRFNGWRLFILFLLLNIVLIIPFSIATLFTEVPIWYGVPLASAIITIFIKLYYKKKVVPIHNDAYNRIISNTQKELDSVTNELNEYKNIYEQETDKVPGELRHQFALDILSEAIRQGYTNNLQESINFYETHLDIIERDGSEAALQILQEINESEKETDERNKVFTLLDP